MIKTFNVYGERNSGTNFLYALISNNFDLEGSMAKKHSLVKEYKSSTNHLNFCIIRNLNDWLQSTYKNPYYIDDSHLKEKFIGVIKFSNKKIINRGVTDYNINLGGKYNLIELRYIKYNSYKKVINKVLVNLDFLQYPDTNKEEFLNVLSQKYNLERKEFNPITTYLGGHLKGYERTDKFNVLKYPKLNYSEILSYNKELEEEINNLTFLL